jgi:hypothetical protein
MDHTGNNRQSAKKKYSNFKSLMLQQDVSWMTYLILSCSTIWTGSKIPPWSEKRRHFIVGANKAATSKFSIFVGNVLIKQSSLKKRFF